MIAPGCIHVKHNHKIDAKATRLLDKSSYNSIRILSTEVPRPETSTRQMSAESNTPLLPVPAYIAPNPNFTSIVSSRQGILTDL